MEQKTLLAIILSVLVLFIYSSFSPHLPQEANSLKLSQTIENKGLINQESSILSPEKTPSVSSFPEKIDTIETDIFLAEFSNIGGKLKKVSLKKYSYSPMLKDILAVEGFENVPFQVEKILKNGIFYIYNNNDFTIKKKYFFDGFKISSTITFFNKTKKSQEIGQKINGFIIDYSSLDKKNLPPNYFTEKGLFEYSINASSSIFRKNNASAFNQNEKRIISEKINWVGFRDRYFCTIVKPEYETSGSFITPINTELLEIKISPQTIFLPPGEAIDLSSVVYVGPQDFKVLATYDPTFKEIINFKIGGFMDVLTFGLTDIISKAMLRILNFTYNIIPNWGICIIILAFLVFGATYPLTLKSMSSMKKMQQFQPEIQKIQERNKDNPQKSQKEMMEFYKKHRFNPFGGCLPSLLQMPVFVSLYQVLWRSFNFKGASFLWIKDLSEPDRLLILPHPIPFFGNEINILPFLVMIVMFFQQKLSAKNMVVSDPAQIAQQKMMANILPLMIGFFFYHIASGLALYFTLFYFLSTFAQWKMVAPGTQRELSQG